MCLKKSYQQLTPRIIDTIQEWGKIKQNNNYWSVNDSKIFLLLEIIKKDMLKENHQSIINKELIDEKIEHDFKEDIINQDN